jgi:hypothetical protein
MEAMYSQTPSDLVFPPQVPFSWTLRSVRARQREKTAGRSIRYRILGSARDLERLAAAISFCNQHDARIELE